MKNAPDHVGVYWARERGYQWWNLIVHIYGISPFFQVACWRYTDDRNTLLNPVINDIDVIHEFGDEITSCRNVDTGDNAEDE